MKSGVVYKDEAQPELVQHLSEIQQPTPATVAVPTL
jgi:hypothetical protein